jgi:hypothetical protein
MSTVKRFFLALVGMSFLASMFTLAPVVAPQNSTLAPKTASAAPCTPLFSCNEANFYSVDHELILMCHNWQASPGDGRNEPGTCVPGSNRVIHYHEKTSSTFGWDDTDGFYVPSGANVGISYVRRGYADGAYRKYYNTGWRKKGGCFDCLYKIKRWQQ